ncbi:MAG: hypothetical protein ABI581_17730, partial [Sediminibacterium sp.]
MESEAKQKVTPKKVKDILAKHGTEVTLEEAEIIMTFLYRMGEVAIAQQQFLKLNPPACPQ